jgi:hypothetical protein
MGGIMSEKTQLLSLIKAEFNRWETLLNSLSEAQILTPLTPSHWSTKDVVAHVRAWQQISIARLEAGLHNTEPDYPEWPTDNVVGAEGDVDQVNAWIYEKYRDLPWSVVHENWRTGFQRFMELGEAIPEKYLMDKEKYPWLKGYALYRVLEGSYEHHHQDHFPPVRDWFQRQKS